MLCLHILLFLWSRSRQSTITIFIFDDIKLLLFYVKMTQNSLSVLSRKLMRRLMFNWTHSFIHLSSFLFISNSLSLMFLPWTILSLILLSYSSLSFLLFFPFTFQPPSLFLDQAIYLSIYLSHSKINGPFFFPVVSSDISRSISCPFTHRFSFSFFFDKTTFSHLHSALLLLTDSSFNFFFYTFFISLYKNLCSKRFDQIKCKVDRQSNFLLILRL